MKIVVENVELNLTRVEVAALETMLRQMLATRARSFKDSPDEDIDQQDVDMVKIMEARKRVTRNFNTRIEEDLTGSSYEIKVWEDSDGRVKPGSLANLATDLVKAVRDRTGLDIGFVDAKTAVCTHINKIKELGLYQVPVKYKDLETAIKVWIVPKECA